ncbi:putative NAD-dependent epimerase/dehydratase [Clostridia bacterium]|nr:putative NAD-dependent epimerase/dehydratase [Clostridia bacterium]
MKIFITGATGFIGTAVTQELIRSGHQVIGLSRSEESDKKLKNIGAKAHRGSLEDLDSLRHATKSADGVIHMAFVHNFTDFGNSLNLDLQAITAMGEALAETGKPFLAVAHANGTQSDNAILALSQHGVRSSVISLAPTVHDVNKHGFASMLIDIARKKGVSAYVGDGTNRWTSIHKLDAALLFRLALESAPGGLYLDGVAEESIPFYDIAETIGKNLNVPIVGISHEEAPSHFGFLGAIVGADLARSSAKTRELLNWKPTHPTLLEDLTNGLNA